MNIEVGARKKMYRFIKFSVFCALLATALSFWMDYNDFIKVEAEQHVLRSQEVISLLGAIKDVSLSKTTYVKGATTYSGEHTPKYNLYRFWVTGTKASGLVIVRVDEPGTKQQDFAVTVKL